jgi:hypothetical protein
MLTQASAAISNLATNDRNKAEMLTDADGC